MPAPRPRDIFTKEAFPAMGNIKAIKVRTRRCSKPGCATKGYWRGMCRFHYRMHAEKGFTTRKPTDEVAAHIRRLHEAYGWRRTSIAAAAGVNESTIHNILRGQYATVQHDTAMRILGVPLTYRGDAYTSPVGMIRRAQALAAIGWPYRVQCRRLGWRDNRIHNVINQAKYVDTRISGPDHDAMVKLYNELSMDAENAPGPIRAEFAPPLAWDDDDLDNPAATPYDVAVAVDTARRKNSAGGKRMNSTATARAHVQALLDDGWSLTGIAQEAGAAYDTVRGVYRRERMHRETLARLLAVGS